MFSGCGPDPVDFGYVGEITEIRTDLIETLWNAGFTPVFNTLGIEPQADPETGVCQIYNINADTVSSAIAATLNAEHLFLITGVPGVLRDKDDPETRIPHLTADQARQAISDQVIVGGMIPKIEEARKNLALGIGAIHILGGQPGAVQAEASQPGSRGTVLTA